MVMKKKKQKTVWKSVLAVELALVCILSAATCGSKLIANIKAENGLENTQTVSGQSISAEPDRDDQEEMRAMWISYIEFSDELARLGKESFTEKEFHAFINRVFDDCVSWNMNTVIVHVRPYGDAFYPSEYFPWSEYISGKQGKNPGFDPLEYMVKAAHERDLKLEAWLNPYRIATGTTAKSSLSSDNPARKWYSSRKVLSLNGNLYYNPAKKAVRELITDGVREIVENYDVDGIHFDDYFYPSLGSTYKKSFDYKEYLSYKEGEDEPLSLVKWRRNNVNLLVKGVYAAVKEENPDVVFGISPAGNISNLLSKTAYYVDIETWLSHTGYVDYICPQVYWTFDNGKDSFDTVTEEWLSYMEEDSIKLYIGIPVYKAAAGKNSVWDWAQWHGKKNILKKQIKYCRNIERIDGFYFFSYQSFIQKADKKEIKNLLSVLN